MSRKNRDYYSGFFMKLVLCAMALYLKNKNQAIFIVVHNFQVVFADVRESDVEVASAVIGVWLEYLR